MSVVTLSIDEHHLSNEHACRSCKLALLSQWPTPVVSGNVCVCVWDWRSTSGICFPLRRKRRGKIQSFRQYINGSNRCHFGLEGGVTTPTTRFFPFLPLLTAWFLLLCRPSPGCLLMAYQKKYYRRYVMDRWGGIHFRPALPLVLTTQLLHRFIEEE